MFVTHPVEFFDRAEVILRSRGEVLFGKSRTHGSYASEIYSKPLSFAQALERLSEMFQCNLADFLMEREFQALLNHIAQQVAKLKSLPKLPFPLPFNADNTIVQLLYAICRALHPGVVLETGVAYGVSSAAILAALHKNRNGVLHSVDLPPISDRQANRFVGVMIPAEYKDRWRLHLGASKRVLPRLLATGLGPVDLVVHDSANLYAIQKMEEGIVWPHLSSRAVMVMNVGISTAFAELAKERNVGSWFVFEQVEKIGHLAGIAVKGRET